MQELPSGGQCALTVGSSAQPQARLMAASTAVVVVEASPDSSAALRMSDCSLGLLPLANGHPPRAAGLAEGCLIAILGPIPRGAGLSQQVVIPEGSQTARGHRPGRGTPSHRVHKFLCTGSLLLFW
uniref:Uncharacterized protein n=1 Tax=Myotis myotis TaxID=51298 RepID=A0A7J8AML1_MYOMY|nr:hypothetical protein mMyoMyo1_007849 [Myotis myotis]